MNEIKSEKQQVWDILKTPPKTQEEIYREVWREAIAAVRAGLYSREDLETHFGIKNED